MGDKLGYYRDLAANGPSTPAQLAERTQTAEPYAREWLNAQAAGGYVTYDPATKRYTLPAEHALAMTDPDSPAFLPGFFQFALGTVHDTQHIVDAARSGAGYGWHQHDTDVHVGMRAVLPPELPRQPRSTRGFPPSTACSRSSATARWSPTSAAGTAHRRSCWRRRSRTRRSSGRITTPSSIETARARAAEAGVADRVRFEVASAQEFSGSGYDLVAMFDCLHDMGDPSAPHATCARSSPTTAPG